MEKTLSPQFDLNVIISKTDNKVNPHSPPPKFHTMGGKDNLNILRIKSFKSKKIRNFEIPMTYQKLWNAEVEL